LAALSALVMPADSNPISWDFKSLQPGKFPCASVGAGNSRRGPPRRRAFREAENGGLAKP
jgi:hypothetical protein